MIQRNDPCWCGSGKKYKRCHLLIEGREPRAILTAIKPSSKMIKDQQHVEGMRRAGEFNGMLLDYIRPYVKVGVTTDYLDRLVYEYTIKHGHKSGCLGYHGFPKSICTSKNDIVCHGIPSDKDILCDGDIVNIDLTTVVDGYYGDSSETFLIGNVSPEAKKIVKVAAMALLKGISAVKPGNPLSAIADAIEPFVQSQGCSVVRQYTGHGIGCNFHEYFSVYHHRDQDFVDYIMMPGMTFTIEPMINLGSWEVETDPNDGWTVRTKDGSLSAQFEHTVLVTQSGVDILTLTPSQRKKGVILDVEGISLE